MPTARACVLRAPGTNCDVETAYAFETAGGTADVVHLYRLLEQPTLLNDYQILCIPGGFSYGDDIGAGVVFASQLRSHLHGVLGDFLERDTLILGICNGFQTLLKAGILPDGAESWAEVATREPNATLTWNENGRYTARWVRLKTTASSNAFLRGLDELDLPIAHAEGRLVARDASVAERWRSRDQVALTYVPWKNPDCSPGPGCSANPNGSACDLAGLSDPTGRVLGLMPHPERYLFATQHPQWTRRRLSGAGEGLKLFQNAIGYFN